MKYIHKNGYELKKKQEYRKNFEGSDRLFNACWGQYIFWLQGAIDNPSCDYDVENWLDQIASEKVNDSRSSFYLYG